MGTLGYIDCCSLGTCPARSKHPLCSPRHLNIVNMISVAPEEACLLAFCMYTVMPAVPCMKMHNNLQTTS